MDPGRFNPNNDTVNIIEEGGWASGRVLMSADNLQSTGIRSPDRPARSSSYIDFAMTACKHVKEKTQEAYIPFAYTNNPTHLMPFIFRSFYLFCEDRIINL